MEPIATASPVVAAINTAVTAAMVGDLADVVVLDGVDPQQSYAPWSVTIAGTWDPDLESFSVDETVTTSTEERGAGRRVVETTTVECIAYSGSGSRDFNTHRTNVSAVMAAVGVALQSVIAVDGASARLRVSSQQWLQGVDGQGAFVMAMFTVTASLLP
jgi:hypothetical protein